MIEAREVVGFWRDAGPAKWFRGGAAFDAACRERLLVPHMAASRRELDAWMDHAEGALALLLLLDQTPRNVFRGSAHAFATDPLARHFAERALEAGFDQAYDPTLRAFFYLPFEHAEDLAAQEHSVDLFEAMGSAEHLRYALDHRDAIAKFGRFPHRNAALGRETTPEEQAWLDAGGGW
jgi:uncharacterized protein (DUF924 family)